MMLGSSTSRYRDCGCSSQHKSASIELICFTSLNNVLNLYCDNHALVCASLELWATEHCKDRVVCIICFANVTSHVSL
jgi:hypothetical protein